MRSESQQVFYIPLNDDPEKVYVNYSNLIPRYSSSEPWLRFNNSELSKYNVDFKSF